MHDSYLGTQKSASITAVGKSAARSGICLYPYNPDGFHRVVRPVIDGKPVEPADLNFASRRIEDGQFSLLEWVVL